MNKKAAIFAVVLFALGWVGGMAYTGTMSSLSSVDHPVSTVGTSVDLQRLQGSASRDKISPSNWIANGQINVFDDEVVLKIKNAKWAVFTDTKSMDPVIDSTSKAIQIIPENENDIHIGDIAAYKSSYENEIITHRVIQIGRDSKGWYAIFKGDNNSYPDPEKARFVQITRVVVAIIY